MEFSQTIDLSDTPSHPRRSGKLSRAVTAGAVAVPALATFLSFGGRWCWQLEWLSTFRLQFAVILLAILIFVMFLRRWQLAWLLALPLVANLVVFTPYYVHPGWFMAKPEFIDQQLDRGPTLTVMSYNINGTFDAMEPALDAIRESPADIVLLQNVSQRNLEELEYAVAPFRVYAADPRSDGYGVVALLRITIRPQIQLEKAQVIPLLDRDNPRDPRAIQLDLRWQGRKITVLTFRSKPVTSMQSRLMRDELFEAVADWAHKQHHPTIIAADLGTVPWTGAFADLLEHTDMLNSQTGHGIRGTWPATGGVVGQVPIDHILIHRSFIATRRWTGPALSSNHYSLNVSLQWAGGAPDSRPAFYNFEDEEDMLATQQESHNTPQARQPRQTDRNASPQRPRRNPPQLQSTLPHQPEPAAADTPAP